jgi:hypothetical protein
MMIWMIWLTVLFFIFRMVKVMVNVRVIIKSERE